MNGSAIAEYVKNYWPIFVTIVTMGVTMVVRDTNNEARISALESRADRQGNSIMTLQVQVTNLSTDVSGIKATLDAVNQNVTYIRNRIDRVTQ